MSFQKKKRKISLCLSKKKKGKSVYVFQKNKKGKSVYAICFNVLNSLLYNNLAIFIFFFH